MRSGTIAFLLGVLCLQQFSNLPHPAWAWLLALSVPLALLLKPYWHLAAWALSGLLWSLWSAQQILAQGLPPELEGRDLRVTGYIAGLPEHLPQRHRFLLDVDQLEYQGQAYPVPGRIRINWYGRKPERLQPGERWELTVRLKRPNGFMNPGGFDYERWLFANGIRATGYVRESPTAQRLDSEVPWRYRVQIWRQQLGESLSAELADTRQGALVRGLAIGDRSEMNEQQWAWLRQTGTAHLLAISGMHIGLVAGLVFWLANRLWRLSGRGTLWLPAPRLAALAAMLAAAAYAALAGFAIPTQRALIMVAVVMWALWRDRPLQPGRTLAWALLLVLIYDPLAVLAAGFWLSFGAVAWILYALVGLYRQPGYARQWWRVQLWVTVGLFPLLLVYFQEVSLISPLANLIAIPLVSVLVVPLILLGLLLLGLWPGAAAGLLGLAEGVLDVMMRILGALSELPLAWVSHAMPGLLASLLFVLGLVLLLQPRGLPGRWLGVVCLLPVILGQFPRPAPGEAWFTLLDVGQGLAAVVQTRNHLLVYDTGPRFSDQFDTGRAVVAPYLRASGWRHIDLLMISHGDNDHSGGAESLLREFPARRIYTSSPERLLAEEVMLCQSGQQWEWDGVRFQVLAPDPGLLRGNDASCVLRVTAGEQHLLLSGDIERRSERVLVATQAARLPAHILVAPHHGSLTSSTPAFVAAVAPDIVLYPVGYRNRWGFPREQVVARYAAQGARQYLSSEQGAMRFSLGGAAGPVKLASQRQTQRRYWHTRLGGSSTADP